MNIIAYNHTLAHDSVAFTLIQYIQHIVPLCFPKYNVVDLLHLAMMNSREYSPVVGERMFKRFGMTRSMIYYVVKYRLKKNITYLQRGSEVTITPEVFKRILVHENSDHKEYLLVLEKCVYYYMDYQNQSVKKINAMIAALDPPRS